MSRYTSGEAARILKLSGARLRYWERTGLVCPGLSEDGRPEYGFRDLVCVRTVRALLEQGVPLRRIRGSVSSLRARVPGFERPLGALRVWLDGSDRVVVRHEGVLLEPEGQLVFDFPLAPEPPEGVASLRWPAPEGSSDPITALEWFERGCLLDSDPRTEPAAIEAYEQCLRADPGFADAHCNLGTIHFNRGRRLEARRCYEEALRADSGLVEAHLNLAGLLGEEGHDESALRHYKAAQRAEPLHPDVQLNLALLYDRFGLPRRAREHWRRYLQLAPTGSWAEIARKHLEETETPG